MNKRKILLTHISEAFYEEIQEYFTVVHIQIEKFKIINIVDTAASCDEHKIVSDQSAKTMKTIIEKLWIFRHGCLKRFSADPGFCRPVLKGYLHDTVLIHLKDHQDLRISMTYMNETTRY